MLRNVLFLTGIISILLLSTALTCSTNDNKSNAFKVAGTINMKEGWIWYSYKNDRDLEIHEKVPIKNGKFTLTGEIYMPTWLSVRFNSNQGETICAIIDAKQNMTMVIDTAKGFGYGEFCMYQPTHTLKGSLSHDAINADYGRNSDSTNILFRKAYKLSDKFTVIKKTTDKKQLKEQLNNWAKEVNAHLDIEYRMDQKWAQAVIDSCNFATLYFYNSLEAHIPIKEQLAALNRFPDRLKVHPKVKEIREKLAIRQKTEVGQMAPDFSLDDSDGKPVNLSDYKGEYLLLEICTDDCTPRRLASLQLADIYHRYTSKGLKVLYVCPNTEPERKFPMNEVIDTTWKYAFFSFRDNGRNKIHFTKMYYTSYHIPCVRLLIDKKGKIVGRWQARQTGMLPWMYFFSDSQLSELENMLEKSL